MKTPSARSAQLAPGGGSSREGAEPGVIGGTPQRHVVPRGTMDRAGGTPACRMSHDVASALLLAGVPSRELTLARSAIGPAWRRASSGPWYWYPTHPTMRRPAPAARPYRSQRSPRPAVTRNVAAAACQAAGDPAPWRRRRVTTAPTRRQRSASACAGRRGPLRRGRSAGARAARRGPRGGAAAVRCAARGRGAASRRRRRRRSSTGAYGSRTRSRTAGGHRTRAEVSGPGTTGAVPHSTYTSLSQPAVVAGHEDGGGAPRLPPPLLQGPVGRWGGRGVHWRDAQRSRPRLVAGVGRQDRPVTLVHVGCLSGLESDLAVVAFT